MSLSVNPDLPQFLGSEVIASYEEAKVVILPIPFEATTTYRKGCENGPYALIEASHQLECYDDELKKETGLETKIYTEKAIADTRNKANISLEEMLEITEKTVTKLIKDHKFVIGLGGEHGITTGLVKAYQKALNEPFTVVQIDAHGDLRNEYEGSIHNHACVMHRILELGLPSLPVAIRSICSEEAELINNKEIPVVWGWDIANNSDWIDQALAKIKTKKVFLTIDLDGIDPSLIPGVGTPEPGGLDWYNTLRFLRRLFTEFEVIGCDVMELAPISDSVVSEFTAAKLVYKLIGYHAINS